MISYLEICQKGTSKTENAKNRKIGIPGIEPGYEKIK
jgi:hypothetical protein